MGRIMDFITGADLKPGYRAEAQPPAEPQPVPDEGPRIVTVGEIGDVGLSTVAGYGALMSVDYMACEQTKARSLSSLPFSVVSRSGQWESFPEHPLAVLFNGMANEEMTAAQFMSWHRLRCDTFGTAYWRVEWWHGVPVAVWPVLCGVFRDFDRSRPEGRRTVFELSGDKYNPAGRYFADEVVSVTTHVTKTGTKGESMARLAAKQIGLSVDLERFYKSMLDNGNHQLGHVEIPEGHHVSEQEKTDLKEAIARKRGVGEAGKAPIFSAGAKWVTDQQTMKDASLIEQQTWILHQVCRACNVPPWKVYDKTGTTYQGSQQSNIDYVTDTIVPDARAIELALRPVLDSMGDKDKAAKLNVKGLMRGDDRSRSQYFREMAYLGAYTPRRICELEDMDPTGVLDKPLFPLNYGTVEEDGSVTVYSHAAKAPGDGSQTGVTDKGGMNVRG